jgi:arginyl-tRNA synthetase
VDYRKAVAKQLHSKLNLGLSEPELYALLEIPKYQSHGDLAFPCFILAKTLRKPPSAIAEELARALEGDHFEEIIANGPYVNFYFNKTKVGSEVITSILNQGHNYGSHNLGHGKNVPIDLSSPNIAKPFSMGHLRSTVIGNSIANILKKCGFNPIKINHLGDWGTQFGKLIVAYKQWGEESRVKENPIKELLKLYVEFHERTELDSNLEQQGRDWFKKLENGDKEALFLWNWFREESLREFNKIYALLEVQFDSFNGEAFYNDKMDEIVSLIHNSGLLIEDNGAMVVKHDEYGLPPSLIKKSDGATLYVTRDLAAAIYRYRNYDFAKAIYVVGNEQTLHFKQLKLVLKKMGYNWSDEMIHVPFGMILKDGKKMSTRKGKVVLLEEVLAKSISMAEQNILEKNPELANKAEVARQVGVGAVIFHDLHNDRLNNIEFSFEDMLKFEGETGPYLQYSYARARSILRKADLQEECYVYRLQDEYSWEMIKLLMVFPQTITKAFNQLEPSVISKYLIDLAQSFNSYYGNARILVEDIELSSRIALVKATAIVLKEGLSLLGIKAPDEM